MPNKGENVLFQVSATQCEGDGISHRILEERVQMTISWLAALLANAPSAQKIVRDRPLHCRHLVCSNK
ncbi:hypothetical protein IE4803_CH03563 [Rhizobium etli bv. phaseoli str. IE4803]|nr:hypothetical protein IE4803_CH03563 [Rhizobium etli bv. phaseoli str. IE4803]